MRKVDLTKTFYYIINDDLKMSKGKIAAQVSHVAMLLADRHGVLGRAIILKGSQSLLENLIRGYPDEVEYIFDAGLTEVPKGSLTCVGFMKNEGLSPFVVDLRLV